MYKHVLATTVCISCFTFSATAEASEPEVLLFRTADWVNGFCADVRVSPPFTTSTWSVTIAHNDGDLYIADAPGASYGLIQESNADDDVHTFRPDSPSEISGLRVTIFYFCIDYTSEFHAEVVDYSFTPGNVMWELTEEGSIVTGSALRRSVGIRVNEPDTDATLDVRESLQASDSTEDESHFVRVKADRPNPPINPGFAGIWWAGFDKLLIRNDAGTRAEFREDGTFVARGPLRSATSMSSHEGAQLQLWTNANLGVEAYAKYSIANELTYEGPYKNSLVVRNNSGEPELHLEEGLMTVGGSTEPTSYVSIKGAGNTADVPLMDFGSDDDPEFRLVGDFESSTFAKMSMMCGEREESCMTWDRYRGRVGIGTDEPSHTLHVSGELAAAITLEARDPDNTDNTATSINIKSSDGTSHISQNSEGLKLRAYGGGRIVMGDDGSICIGTNC